MWLSSFHLTNSSETSYMDFSWFYRRMGKYYAEEDNRTLRHQFTLETGEYNNKYRGIVELNYTTIRDINLV